MSLLLPLVIALPALAAWPVAWLSHARPLAAGSVAALVLSLVVILLLQSPGASWHWAWLPQLGLSLSFVHDPWGGLFALLAAGIGAPLLLYAGGYASHDHARGRLLACLLLFSSAMLGLVLADGLLTAFVFWEATSLLSWFLVAHAASPTARAAAKRALLVTGLGGLALLAALVLLGLAGGVWQFSQLENLADHPLSTAALLLALLAITTKSALAPWQFWLPGAMAAPTPASAYLHAATMVKAGILLLGRLFPVLGAHAWWQPLLLTSATITIVLAAVLMLRRRDLKAILAGSTLATLAACSLLAATGSPAAMAALPALVLAHALYKSGLFLTVGAIDHAAHTRDLARLRGLARSMPLVLAGALLAFLGAIGWSPVGAYAKSLLMPVVADHALVAPGLLLALALSAAAGFSVLRPLWGQPGYRAAHSHAPDWAMQAGILLPGLLSLLPISFFPMLTQAQQSLAGEPGVGGTWYAYGALALGTAGFYFRKSLGRVVPLLGNGAKVHDSAWYAALAMGRWIARHIPGVHLSAAVLATLLLTGGLALLAMLEMPDPRLGAWEFDQIGLFDVLLALVAVCGGVAAAATRSPAGVLAGLGATGMALSVLFLLHSAPDLALTQFLVEVLGLILLLAALRRLPSVVARPAPGWSLPVAALTGAFVGGLVLVALASPGLGEAASYMRTHSLSDGHGRNVVNVILVDFRALDTLGEIAVLGTAALGAVLILARNLRRAEPSRLQMPPPNATADSESNCEKPQGQEVGV